MGRFRPRRLLRAAARALAARSRGWLRRSLGWAWLGAWAAVLLVAHRPWHELGGLIDERLRWLERTVLALGLVAGCLVGRFARDAAQSLFPRVHLDSLRRVWIPPAALVALALTVSAGLGRWRWTLLLLNAFLAYWAGLDASIGAWPLSRGRDYHPARRIARAVRERPDDDFDDDEED